MSSTILRIPLRSGEPSQALTVLLDGVRFRLVLDWNGRIGRWVLGLSHADSGRLLFGGRVLAARSDLLRLYRFSDDCPRGSLVLVDASGAEREPDLTSLGLESGHALWYLPAD